MAEGGGEWKHDDEPRGSDIGAARRESITLDDLRERVTSIWETQLREGITMEKAVGPYETETVDITETIAREMEYWAYDFGWNWKRPDDAPGEPMEDIQ